MTMTTLRAPDVEWSGVMGDGVALRPLELELWAPLLGGFSFSLSLFHSVRATLCQFE